MRELFRGVTISIEQGDRIGFIGPNGAGKSTLMRMLAGAEDPDTGEIRRQRGAVVVYVPQRDDFPAARSVISVATDAAMRCARIHGDIHEASVVAKVILGKIGFRDEAMDDPVDLLSGGWKKRLSVACGLCEAGGSPDLLLLDEPTNHLDVEGIEWLEGFLTRGTSDLSVGACVFVTHDRAFLDSVANRVVELSRAYPQGTLSAKGNYSEFVRRRSEFLEGQSRAQEALANEVRIDDAWLARGAQARRTKAKGRIEDSALRRDELAALSQRNASAAASGAAVDFTASGRRTRKLVAAHGVSKGYSGRTLLRGLDMEIAPGDRIGIMGPNGSGKTTLLRVLCGETPPDTGSIRFADPMPRIVVMRQQRADIDPSTLLKDAICPLGDRVDFQGSTMHITAWARRFLFHDAQLLQPISSLSGGERARAHLARMMLEPADILVLDEPTNDLDIPTLEVLEEAVESFAGGVLLVTHDRRMLERLAGTVAVLGDPDGSVAMVASLEQALRALGQFQRDAQERARALRQLATPTTAPAKAKAAAGRGGRLSYHEQREFDAMEGAIAAAEAAQRTAESRLADPAIAGDHLKLAQACRDLESANSAVASLYERWQQLESKRG